MPLSTKPNTLLFKEEQRFHQWWLWLLLLALLAIPLAGGYVQLVEGRPWGDQPMSNTGLWIFIMAMLAFVGFFRWMKLETVCDHRGLRIWFRPFVRRRISWEAIEKAEIVDYGFVGYGIRLGSKYGTIYNTSGRLGLAVRAKDGTKFVIGTLQPDELNEVVQRQLQKQRV